MSKERYIWIKGEKIPVSEEVYLEYYRPVWAEKKRKERGKRCRTSNGNRCAEDCEFCDKNPDGSFLSFDKFLEEGYEVAVTVGAEELVMEKILLDELYAALAELTSDERSLINTLFIDKKSERNVAAEQGVQRNTIVYHKNKILGKLKIFLKKF